MSRVWNVAHRGASSERPENTLAAYELAVAQGADVVEADVRVTADERLVVMHDQTVDRTTDGAGAVGALEFADVRALDAGDGERVPTPEEVLELARGRVRVNLDLKELAAVEPTLELVRALDMSDSVTFISFLPEVWDAINVADPEAPVIHLVSSAPALAGLAMGEAGSQSVASGVGLAFGLVSHELVERLHRHGYGVFAWTVDDESEMRRLVDCGINGIVTNRPAALAEVLRQMNLQRVHA